MKTKHWLAFGVSAFWTLRMAYGSTAHAHTIDPGIDLFEVGPSTSLVDFSADPIPPDFFGPGSDQLEGLIALHGQPPVGGGYCPVDDLSLVSVLIRRDSPAPATIPIQLLELSLVSSEPVTVTYSGGSPELWDLQVGLSPGAPSTGQMTILHEDIAGGTIGATFFIVNPLYTFVRRGDSAVRQIDAATRENYAFTLQHFAALPWIHAPELPGSCRSNWCPSPNQAFDLIPYLGAGGFALRLTSLCSQQPVAVDAASWGRVKSAYGP